MAQVVPMNSGDNKQTNRQYRSRQSVLIKQGGSLMKTDVNIESENELSSYRQLITGENLEVLENIKGIIISQQIEMWEAISGCDFPMNYIIYPATKSGNRLMGVEPLFLSAQVQSLCTVFCIPSEAMDMDIVLYNYRGQKKTFEDKNSFLFAKRESNCGLFCFNRKDLIVTYKDKNKKEKTMGTISHPFNCMNIKLEIKDDMDKLKYQVISKKTQLGHCCKGFCLKVCQNIVFEIQDNKNVVLTTAKKNNAGICQACCDDIDDFNIVFPEQADKYDKALLMISLLFLNYMYYEENPLNKNKNLDDVE